MIERWMFRLASDGRGLHRIAGLATLGLLAPSPMAGAHAAETPRILHADIVALDQLLVYNRFGSFNPFGMIFALRRDVSAATDSVGRPDADLCGQRTGAEPGTGALTAGEVRLRDCKRPRPLVLRANAGDIVEITVTNLLRPDQPGISGAHADPPARRGKGFCEEPSARRAEAAPVRPEIGHAFDPARGEAGACAEDRKRAAREAAEAGLEPDTPSPGSDWPRTRGLSLVMPGLEPVPLAARTTIDGACTGLDAIAPGESVTCRWKTDREGTHLFSSLAAPAGGEGDAGSLGHGLFGALIVEPAGARVFRSQVTSRAFDAVWARSTVPGARPHARDAAVDFDARTEETGAEGREAGGRVPAPRNGPRFTCGATRAPILEAVRACPSAPGAVELVHGDLNAVVVPGASEEPTALDAASTGGDEREWRIRHEARAPFREFTVVFHDELKTYYADPFRQLEAFGQFSGVRDGFAINYGASGVGSALLANRLKIGPAADCPECLYEEFFLESWANGDPALLEAFPDDPSNVHHAYLNDKVVFRNLHAGKETHVFHLHSHQWFAGNDAGRGAYLDSQTIGPQQGFTYRIYHGGLERYAAPRAGTEAPAGWWDSLGAGNRNRTPGDAIFHCHLYPHFAQGMWALWRVHDVLEDGTRLLPDGQRTPGLSLTPNAEPKLARTGSVGPAGQWLAQATRRHTGTPVPGLVPLPGLGLPPLPTYTPDAAVVALREGEAFATEAMPGYPFYIAGKPGHRAPQPPLDMARAEAHPPAGLDAGRIAALGRAYLDGGLPRHVVTGGRATPGAIADLPEPARRAITDKGGLLARMAARGDMTSTFEHLEIELLPQAGTVLERNAMAFHGLGGGVAVAPASPGPETLADGLLAAVPLPAGTVDAPSGPATTRLDPGTGAYPTRAIPVAAIRDGPGRTTGATPLAEGARFAVNGSPGAPGAPFADPCAAPRVFGHARGPRHRRYDPSRTAWAPDPAGGGAFTVLDDPFGRGRFVADPGLVGLRRFDVSAVELRLIVNRAGWHDPQARINVLSNEAGAFKGRARSDAEPFFFRAFSGECLTFHHTNETPKTLQLDDFQMAVPTDTIGQHIHLVKFDVTASDGSGNGFNYEDGTFAPDEVLERICVSRGHVRRRPGEAADTIEPVAHRSEAECRPDFIKGVPARERLSAGNLKYFQTTVQRWFADPILSDSGADGAAGVADRTLRTVFSHDHFGPSNIQQHGFYSALLIEPAQHAVCPLAEPRSSAADGKACVAGPAARTLPAVPTLAADPPRDLVGARASVFRFLPDRQSDDVSGDPLHVDAREYAIAVADFALLYDGKAGHRDKDPLDARTAGIDRLLWEGRDPAALAHDDDDPVGEIAPNAFLRLHGIGLNGFETGKLQDRRDVIREVHGRPVAAPPRPEAISQKHHDPYLVNYRNEPVPLRIGTGEGADEPAFLRNPCRASGDDPGALRERADGLVRQRPATQGGDLADLFRSGVHGDPCTPILEALSGERVVVRLIQGAQEVQHSFMLEGRVGRRNVDQPFPSERPKGPEGAVSASRAAACASAPFAREGLPRSYAEWAARGIQGAYWAKFDAWIAGCDNRLGHVAAQEIGISEHFEIGGIFSGTRSVSPGLVRPPSRPPVLDTLYHFGSTDAVWNGAWGLIRAYESAASSDISACLGRALPAPDYAACLKGGGAAIGLRLEPLRDLRARLTGEPDSEAPPRSVSAPGGDSAGGPAGRPVRRPDAPGRDAVCATRVEATAVAVSAAEAMPSGTPGLPYGHGQFDPDGMMLVALDVDVAAAAPPLTRSGLVDAVRARIRGVPGPSPFVLRVQAGDCLDLTVINALPARAPGGACRGDRHGDAPGDAPMPRIVPLNTDCDARQYRGSRTFEAWTGDPAGGRRDVAPSRRLALSIPLPATGEKPDGTLPVGANAVEALAPVADDAVPNALTTQYYAGFLSVRDDATAGRDPATTGEGIRQIPYAFGALPIRSVGDIVSHGSHGLLGTLVVEARSPESPRDFGWRHDTARAIAAPCIPLGGGRDDPAPDSSACASPDARRTGAVVPAATFAEHVLVWQDGLGLRRPYRPGTTDLGLPGRPVPDCPVCDDSYDLGEKGVSYRSEPFAARLLRLGAASRPDLGLRTYPRDGDDLNRERFPPDFLRAPAATPLVTAHRGQEIALRIVHPSARARQRAFVPLFPGYDDLFPGFGSGHSALIGPGKGLTAWSRAPCAEGRYLWRDGQQPAFASGAWGHLAVSGPAGAGDLASVGCTP